MLEIMCKTDIKVKAQEFQDWCSKFSARIIRLSSNKRLCVQYATSDTFSGAPRTKPALL